MGDNEPIDQRPIDGTDAIGSVGVAAPEDFTRSVVRSIGCDVSGGLEPEAAVHRSGGFGLRAYWMPLAKGDDTHWSASCLCYCLLHKRSAHTMTTMIAPYSQPTDRDCIRMAQR